MRKEIWLAAILVAFVTPRFSAAQQASQSAQTSQSASDRQTTAPSKTPAQSQPAATKGDSLADAARKAREAQKTAPKAAKVFTNDNIPTSSSGVSVVGNSSAAPAGESAASGTSDANAAAGADKNDEATWRKKFADARRKIDQDSAELSIMQREYSELNVQYYPDPTKALMQSVDRTDLIKKQNAIDAKQKELDADKQALSDLEDELRKAGGDPGWARE